MKYLTQLSAQFNNPAKLNLIFFQIKSFIENNFNLSIAIGDRNDFINMNNQHHLYKGWYHVPEFLYLNPRSTSLFITDKNNINKIYGSIILSPLDLPKWMSFFDALNDYSEIYFKTPRSDIQDVPEALKTMKGSVIFCSGFYISSDFTSMVLEYNQQHNTCLYSSWILTVLSMLYMLGHEDADFATIFTREHHIKKRKNSSNIERYDLNLYTFGPIWDNMESHGQVNFYTVWTDKMAMMNSSCNMQDIILNKDKTKELNLLTREFYLNKST